ncbi:MAG TPA: hypothetical protein VK483_04510 [Chitinophagaceae bacterium]|nr:hypothetical protein [Chitinophagaceae bacterium]
MRHLLPIFIFTSFLSCNGQEATKQIHFPQVGWTLSFPENSEFFSWQQIDSFQNATANKIKSRDYIFTTQEVLFVIKNDRNNFFGSTITPFDSTNFKTWQSSYSYAKQTVLDVVQSKKSVVTLIDTAASTEIIDGVIFQMFFMRTEHPNIKIIRDSYWYYTENNGIELSINISFTDSIIGNKYLSVLRESKFDK